VRGVLVSIVVGLAMVTVSACADDSSTEPVTIIAIGDSLTENAGASTYRCHLDAMLNEAGVDFDFVGSLTSVPASDYDCSTEFDRDHEAVNGATIDTRAGPAVESVELLQPDVALVLLGENDLVRQSPTEVADELASLVEDLQAASPDIMILVAQYTPCQSTSSWCQNMPAFNDAIESFARLSTEQSSVTVVDMFTDFSLDGLQDSAHMNDAGAAEMARRWMAALTDSGAIGA